MEAQQKIRENKVRRMARRQGLSVTKSRRRDPPANDFGVYWLVDERDRIVFGGGPEPGGVTLDEIEEYLVSLSGKVRTAAMSVGDLREAVAARLESTAWWRDQKAKEHPEDPRNGHAAATLRTWANEARAMPDEDPVWRPFLLLAQRRSESDGGVLLMTEDELDPVGRVGFAGEAASLHELLIRLAVAVRKSYERLDEELAADELD
jgi:hypothetical protein